MTLTCCVSVYVGPELQEAFQVSSSPDHLKYRYLVWNEVGTITSREEDDSSYINIGILLKHIKRQNYLFECCVKIF